ncbi:hypothetical protein BaRGS_00028041, partial [Batillaria attramentaria]
MQTMKTVACVVCFMCLLGSARAVASYVKAICDRNPIHTTAPKTAGDNGFTISVEGLPTPGKYRPGEVYTDHWVLQSDEGKEKRIGVLCGRLSRASRSSPPWDIQGRSGTWWTLFPQSKGFAAKKLATEELERRLVGTRSDGTLAGCTSPAHRTPTEPSGTHFGAWRDHD